MTLSRWIALVFVGLYIATFLWLPAGAEAGRQHALEAARGLALIPLVLGFLCLWWSEALGDALFVGRGAWNPKPSSEGAVKLLGWVFMISALVLSLAGDRIIPAVMGTP